MVGSKFAQMYPSNVGLISFQLKSFEYHPMFKKMKSLYDSLFIAYIYPSSSSFFNLSVSIGYWPVRRINRKNKKAILYCTMLMIQIKSIRQIAAQTCHVPHNTCKKATLVKAIHVSHVALNVVLKRHITKIYTFNKLWWANATYAKTSNHQNLHFLIDFNLVYHKLYSVL